MRSNTPLQIDYTDYYYLYSIDLLFKYILFVFLIPTTWERFFERCLKKKKYY